MPRKTLLSLLLLPLLLACSDQRASFEIGGSSQHSLTLIRIQNFVWEKSASYSVVAARMPECMRRHDMGKGGASTPVEVYAPGNDAWILKQGRRMQVVETRTCEGFARLEEPPAEGMGPLQGRFEMRNGSLSFVAAAQSQAATGAPTDAGAPAQQ